MFSFKNNRYYKSLALTLMLLALVSVAFAKKNGNQITQVISSIGNTSSLVNKSSSSSNSSVTFDFSLETGESWDEKDNTNNLLTNCFNGTAITGFEYSNITIETVGGSFYSEAVLYFSSSNNGDDGIQLTIGSGNESSGTTSFSSNGLLDITDTGNLDVFSLADRKFNLQIYEKIDDVPNSIDAKFIDGSLQIFGEDLIINDNCPFVLNSSSDADLSVTHSSEIIDQNQIGSSIQILIDVTNNSSENNATNVRLNSTLSDNLIFTQASCDDSNNSADANEIMALSVNDIPPDATLQCTLTADITETGEYTNDLIVLSDNDPNISNNNILITVRGPAAIVVPANNLITLLLLAFALFYTSRKLIKA
jgi:hypothetical protein